MRRNVLIFLSFLLLASLPARAAELEDFRWRLLAGPGDSTGLVEVLVSVANDTAISAAALDIGYDTNLMELPEPAADQVRLLGRASDLQVFVSRLPAWSHVRLTVFSMSPEPPYAVLEAGAGPVASVRFRPVSGADSTAASVVTLRMKNGPEVARLELER